MKNTIKKLILKKITQFSRHYLAEIILISISFVILMISLLVLVISNSANSASKHADDSQIRIASDEADIAETIIVEIAGAVEQPDVYEIPEKSRLKDLLLKANGLSKSADRTFFARNFNLAEMLKDEEKIYIPSVKEVEEGLYGDVLDESSAQGENMLINVNTSDKASLDLLPGVGPVIADKIIAGRQYKALEELVTRKIIGKSLFEKIKDKLAIN